MAHIHPTHIDQLNRSQGLPSHIAEYITAFESPLSPEQLNSPEFAYRIFFVPKLAKSEGQADEVIQFVKVDAEVTKEVNTIYFKEREKSKYLPKTIVKLMQSEGYKRFRLHEHTLLWKSLKAKQPPKAYGVKVAQTWYWYEAWIDIVRKHCKENEVQYKALVA